MDERTKKLLDERGGMSFIDSDLPPDPTGKVPGEKKEVKKMKKIFDKFENERKEDAMEGEGKGKEKDEVYELTDEDMPTQVFEGERIDIDGLLDEPIIIRDMATRPSSFSEGDYAIIQVEKEGKPYVVLTGSSVLMRLIKEKADKLPFKCKIIEQQSTRSKYRYYTLAPVRSAVHR